MYGCAYMGNESLQSTVSPLFHLWLERPEQSYGHKHCDNTQSTYNESLLLQHNKGRVRCAGPMVTVKLPTSKTTSIYRTL